MKVNLPCLWFGQFNYSCMYYSCVALHACMPCKISLFIYTRTSNYMYPLVYMLLMHTKEKIRLIISHLHSFNYVTSYTVYLLSSETWSAFYSFEYQLGNSCACTVCTQMITPTCTSPHTHHRQEEKYMSAHISL